MTTFVCVNGRCQSEWDGQGGGCPECDSSGISKQALLREGVLE